MSKSTVFEVPLESGGTVQIKVSPDGDVKVLGARRVVAVYQIQPTPEQRGESKEVIVDSVPLQHGRGVDVSFERIAESSWASRGLARPGLVAILQSDDQTIEVLSFGGKINRREKNVLSIVPPRAAVGLKKGVSQ